MHLTFAPFPLRKRSAGPLLNRKVIISLVWLILVLSGSASSNESLAATFTFSGSGDWTDPTKWSPSYPGTTINSGDEAVITNVGSCIIPAGAVVTIAGTLTNNGSFSKQTSATLTINGTLNNNSLLSIFGLLTNNGTINNNSLGSITNSGTLNNEAGATLNNSNTLSIDFSATLNNNGTLNNNSGGQVIGNGTFNNISGAAFNNSETVGISGTLDNKGTLTNSGGFFGILGTGTLKLSGGNVNNTATNINIGSGATIERSGGTISLAPNFQGNVNLIYSGTIALTSGPELPTSLTALQNLTINNTGGVTLSATTKVNNTLTINNGATLSNSAALTAVTTTINSGGTLNNNFALTTTFLLTINSGGTLTSNGGFTNNSNSSILGTLNNNGLLQLGNSQMTIFMSGTLNNNTGASVNINGGGSLENSGLLDNNSGAFVNANAGGILANFGSGTLSNDSGGTIQNSHSLTNSGTFTNNGTLNNSSGANLHNNGVLTSSGAINNSGTFTTNSGATLTSNGSLSLTDGNLNNTASNITIGNGATIERNIGTISVAPNFAGSVNLVYNGSTAITTGPEVPAAAAALNNLTMNKSGGVTLGANATVNGTLLFSNGILFTAANILSMGTSATVAGGSNSSHVRGNLKKNYNAGASSFTFPVGTANSVSPVTANTTAASGAGSLTVTAVQGPHPVLNPAVSLQRYWTLSGSGVTVDLVFKFFDPPDVARNVFNYRIIRVTGSTAVRFDNNCAAGSPCVDPFAQTATIKNVSGFSDWTLGEPVLPTAADSTVSGRIIDNNGDPVEGAGVRLNGTQNRLTVTDALGNYHFDNVETSGFYTVTPSRANFMFNPTQRSFSQLGQRTDAAFNASFLGDTANPLDTAEFFVRQQYVDILGRDPDEGGLNYWTDRILECGGNDECVNVRRREVAAAFFIEREFQDAGSFIYDTYKAALSRQPAFAEYSSDRRQVVGGSNLEAKKTAFAESFVQRPEFVQRYQGKTTVESFVDALIHNVQQASGVDLGSARETLISSYNKGSNLTQSRGLVLRDVADNATLKQAEYNAAFVLTEYFGYLRRDPDPRGYAFWLNILNERVPGNYRAMVCAFLTSVEYQRRFSSVVTHNNSECAQ